MVLLVALGSLGVGYAKWSNVLTISSSMKTASLPTNVDKAPNLSIPTSGAFTSPDNAFISDNNRAYTIKENISQQYGNFHFSIPSGSTISGILVTIEGQCGKDSYFDVQLSYDGTNFTPVTAGTPYRIGNFNSSNDVIRSYGGSSETWARTPWAASDFNDGNFKLKLTSVGGQISNGKPLYVDYVHVTIYYTPP